MNKRILSFIQFFCLLVFFSVTPVFAQEETTDVVSVLEESMSAEVPTEKAADILTLNEETNNEAVAVDELLSEETVIEENLYRHDDSENKTVSSDESNIDELTSDGTETEEIAFTADIFYEQAGDNIYATLDDMYNLTFTGSGAMWEMEDFQEGIFPWQNGNDIQSVTIGEGITSVSAYAFQYVNFTSISFPSTLKNIDDYAFNECYGLSELNLPSSLEQIGNSAFSNCSSLTELTLPSGLLEMEDSSFSGCSSIESIDLSQTALTNLNFDVFGNCTNLKQLRLPTSITYISNDALSGVFDSSFTVYAASKAAYDWALTNGYNVELRTTLFSGTVASPSAPISGASVRFTQSISDKAYETVTAADGTFSLTVPIYPGTLEISAKGYFDAKFNINESDLLEETFSIELSPKIPQFKINLNPASDLTNYAGMRLQIYNNETLKRDFVIKSQSTYGLPAYYDSGDILTARVINAYGMTIASAEQRVTDESEDITLTLDSFAVVRDVTASVKDLSGNAYEKGVTLTWSDGAGTVYPSGNTLSAIPIGTMLQCNLLLTDDIFVRKTTIDWEVTDTGNALVFEVFIAQAGDNITVTLDNEGKLTFAGSGPMWTADQYTGAQFPWDDYHNDYSDISIGEGITEVSDFAFSDSQASTIVFPSSLVKIGDNAFSGCDQISEISLSNTKLASIGNNALSSCAMLSQIDFPTTLSSLGNSAFNACGGIQSIDLSKTAVTALGDSVFCDNTSLTELWLPKTLESISDSALTGCSEENLSIHAASVAAHNWASDNGWKVESSLTITAKLVPLSDLTDYAGMKLEFLLDDVILDDTQTISAKSSYSHTHTITSGTILTARVLNAYGTVIASASHAILNGTELTLNNFVTVRDITASVKEQSGKSYDSKATFSWSDTAETVYPNSKTLTGIPIGTVLTCGASLKDIPLRENQIEWTVADSGNEINFLALPTVSLSGTVMTLNKTPISGATLSYSQEIQAGDPQVAETLSTTKGSFSLSVPAYSGVLTVSADGYETQTITVEQLTSNSEALKITLIPNVFTVKLSPASGLSNYSGMTLQLIANDTVLKEQSITEENSYRCDGTFTAETVFSAQVFNTYGMPIASASQSIKDGAVLTLNNFVAVRDVTATVKEQSGKTYNDNATFSWSDTAETVYPNSATLKGIPIGTLLTCGVLINDIPLDGNTAEITVGMIGNEVNFLALPIVNLNGVITDEDDTPVEGASLSFTQEIHAGSPQVTTAVSETDGSFSLDVPAYSGVLHINAAGFIPEEVSITTVTDGMAAQNIQLNKKATSITLLQKDIILTVGKSIKLKYDMNGVGIEWKVVAPDMKTPSDIVSVTNGEITAKAVGTAYVLASINNNSDYCRVEVQDNITVKRAFTTESKVTLDLFKISNLPNIPIILDLNRSLSNTLDDNAGTIQSARFTENIPFRLNVIDDRHLEVEYNGGESLSAIKTSYKSGITLNINDVEYPLSDEKGKAQQLTITVKKTLPKLKASAIKLNSLIPNDSAVLFVSGAENAVVALDSDLPDWLSMNETKITLKSEVPTKASSKLSLSFTSDDWYSPVNVTLPVSAAPTAPKIKVNPSSITLNPGTSDTAKVVISVTPETFAAFSPEVVSVLEGKSSAEDALVFKLVENVFTITAPNSDGRAHTYTVNGKLANTPFKFTVKLLPENQAVSTAAKVNGTIDLTLPGSSVAANITVRNFNPDDANMGLNICRGAKDSTACENVNEQFEVTRNGSIFVIKAQDTFTAEEYSPSDEYYVCPYVCMSEECTESAAPCTNKTKLSVIQSDPAKVPISVKVKLSGTIDPIRPESAVTLTPTFKNWYTYQPDAGDLNFYRKNGKNYEALPADTFDISVEGNSFVIRSRNLDHSQKYYVEFCPSINEKTYSTPKTALSVKMGKSTIVISTAKSSLFKIDPTAPVSFKLTVNDPAGCAISKVLLDSKSEALFDLQAMNNGNYLLAFKDNQPVNVKSASVKLSVFLTGNLSDKPNNQISLGITIK